MNNLTIFKYEKQQVRVVIINGDPWWVAKDVCGILELSDVNKAIQHLDKEEKLLRTLFVSGQNREVLIISESGVYELVIRSNKPEAKPFRKWVTKYVLPSIRKTGSYGQVALPTHLETARLLVESLEKVEQLEIENSNLENEAQRYYDELEIQDPIVEEWEKFLDSGQLISFKQMSNMLKIPNFGRNSLYDLLRNLKILCLDNTPRQNFTKHFKTVPANLPQHWNTNWKWSKTTTYILPTSFTYIKDIVYKALNF